jgi:hypothetical protein
LEENLVKITYFLIDISTGKTFIKFISISKKKLKIFFVVLGLAFMKAPKSFLLLRTYYLVISIPEGTKLFKNFSHSFFMILYSQFSALKMESYIVL